MVCVQTSCMKDELPVPAHEAGDVLTASVDMETNYKWQIYYSLRDNKVVSQNLKTDWDLGFEANPEGYRVVLNTSKAMFVRKLETTSLTATADTNGFEENKRWDESSGNLDSTAIGDWRQGNIYIIDRGSNEKGKHQGWVKLQILSVDDKQYTVSFGPLNSENISTVNVPKDDAYNMAFLSFDEGGKVVSVEPPKADWDVVFTQYTYIFYEEVPVTPYLVTGCLLNRYNTKGLMTRDTTFEAIDLDFALGKTLSTNYDAIGYEWKSFNGATYTVYPEMNYLIETQDGNYFKLHFIDFFNSGGAKGYPKWEYQLL